MIWKTTNNNSTCNFDFHKTSTQYKLLLLDKLTKNLWYIGGRYYNIVKE